MQGYVGSSLDYPATSALTLFLHQSHNACTANHHIRDRKYRNGGERRTKIRFGRTMIQVLELL